MNQYNKKTGKVYEGRNQAELLNAKENNNYQSDEWLTFLQARELGLKIKKGSKGVGIFKGFGKIEKKDKDGKIKVESGHYGFAKVFNMDCTEKVKVEA
ncbi:ArdC family protein [Methanoculleus sp.]|uniref:ArdC family protein n=1 Tax=Methanoculleus sp. TaxID=90427 RepID=UPI0025D327BD|nr:ArdC family protein [Methanoculleus sp.]MCK9318907.1 ArdC family protein [Methanoculleus sp.]